MALNSIKVVAWNDAEASEYNDLRLDAIILGGEHKITTWSANAYILAIDSDYVAYASWDKFEFQANFTNTGSCTLNVNTLWAKILKDPAWNTFWSGAIVSGATIRCVYNWTDLICIWWIKATASNIWFVEMASDSEATTWTDEEKYLNSKQAKDNYDKISVTWIGTTWALTVTTWWASLDLWAINDWNKNFDMWYNLTLINFDPNPDRRTTRAWSLKWTLSWNALDQFDRDEINTNSTLLVEKNMTSSSAALITEINTQSWSVITFTITSITNTAGNLNINYTLSTSWPAITTFQVILDISFMIA